MVKNKFEKLKLLDWLFIIVMGVISYGILFNIALPFPDIDANLTLALVSITIYTLFNKIKK